MSTLKHIFLRTAALMTAAMFFGFLIFASLTTRPAVSAKPRAEAIVALTGGTRRIRAAGKLLQAKQADRLLISGVNRVVSRAHLRKLLDIDEDLFACCVDIGYAAQNTRGNAIETRQWARKHEFKSLIVVTSSYHMPRSLNELGNLLPAVDLFAHPVVPERFRNSPWWLDRKNVTLLGAEYLKYLPSAAQFGIGRLIDTPQPTKSKPAVHRAVAIQ